MTEPNATFTCDHCGGTFPDEPEDEAAASAELERDYPGLSKAHCARICDQCYKDFNAWRATVPPERVVSASIPLTEEQMQWLEANPDALSRIEADVNREFLRLFNDQPPT
jgi:hypothetical protein